MKCKVVLLFNNVSYCTNHIPVRDRFWQQGRQSAGFLSEINSQLSLLRIEDNNISSLKPGTENTSEIEKQIRIKIIQNIKEIFVLISSNLRKVIEENFFLLVFSDIFYVDFFDHLRLRQSCMKLRLISAKILKQMMMTIQYT